jgi:biofilm PGA synthesis protein PgaA
MNLYKKSLISAAVLVICGNALAQGYSSESKATELARNGKPLDALQVLDSDPTSSTAVSGQIFRIYLLTDTQQFEKAIGLANTLVAGEPRHAGARLAQAYALRHAGKSPEALSAYQEVVRLDPGNKDALIGQVLMLQAVGAPVLAQELASKNKLALPQKTINELRHAQAIQLIRLAPAEPDQASVRRSKLAEAISILQDLSLEDPSRVPDLVAALARNNQHDEAIAEYEKLLTRVAAPSWLAPDIANSYMAKKKYRRAQVLLERAVQENPNEPEIWTALFYLYSDTVQASEAQQLIDATVSRCEAKKCPSLDTALALQVYSRLWASDVSSARTLVTTALAKRPGSIDLKSAYVAVLNSSGLRTSAREQVQALATQNPDVLDFKIASLALDPANTKPEDFEAELQLLEREFPGNSQVIRARTDWERSRSANVQYAHRIETDDSSSSTLNGITVTSAALNPQGVRLVASVEQTDYRLSGDSGLLRYGSFGAILPVTFGTEFQGHVTSVNSTTGFKLQGRHILSDSWYIDGALALNSEEVPFKAIAAGTTLNTLSLGAGYRINETQELGFSANVGNLTDGNSQAGLSASHVKSGALTPNWSYRWTTRAGLSTNSNQNVPYFSPEESAYLESEISLTRKVWLSNGNYVTVRPFLSKGLVRQKGYGTLPTTLAGLGLTFNLGENITLDMTASVSHKPYDGENSVQSIFGLLLTWVWY